MQSPTANLVLPIPLSTAPSVESLPASESAGSILELTRGLASGKDSSFTEFHSHYFDRLYRFLLVVSRGNEEEAQEALQQTLLRVLRYARPFESEDAFWSWLKALGRSAARDAGRKRQRYLALLETFALRGPPAMETAESLEEGHLQSVLAECLEHMRPEDAQALHAKYVLGATVKELASRAGVTEKSIESRLLRLRRELRERVLKKLNGP